MVEIIGSTYELVNFEMPERFSSGEARRQLDLQNELRGKVNLEILNIF